MPAVREFSDEELRVGSLRSLDAIGECLAVADLDGARRYARRLRREVLAMLGSYDGWERGLLAEVAARGGDPDALLTSIADPTIAPERCTEATGADAFRARAAALDAEIASGDVGRAEQSARSLHEAALRRHDRGMSRVSALLSHLAREYGAEAVDQALTRVMASDLTGTASFRERAEALMHFTRVHLQPFELSEDAEKLTFLCPVCPSGGRLLREGHYDAPRNDARVRGPAPITWGLSELPAYCCHEPAMERASIEATGVPLFVVEPAERLGEQPCRTFLYKRAEDIPERYYRRVGLEKPKRPKSG